MPPKIVCGTCGAEVWWGLPQPEDPCYECGAPIGKKKGKAIVLAGHAGHDHEITVTLDEYGHGPPLDKSLGPIPRPVEQQIVSALPDAWKIENRGSRLEVHPSGHFAGGFSADDTVVVLAALIDLGYEVDDRT